MLRFRSYTKKLKQIKSRNCTHQNKVILLHEARATKKTEEKRDQGETRKMIKSRATTGRVHFLTAILTMIKATITEKVCGRPTLILHPARQCVNGLTSKKFQKMSFSPRSKLVLQSRIAVTFLMPNDTSQSKAAQYFETLE